MNFTKLLIVTAIFGSTSANAANVICPATVKVGKPLIITSAKFTNDDCGDEAVTIKNTVLTLIGNSGSAIGMQGPFVTPFTSSIPPATCETIYFDPDFPENGSYNNFTSGTKTLNNLQVIKKVPASMKGTLVVASAAVLDDKNKMHMAGSCLVTVTP